MDPFEEVVTREYFISQFRDRCMACKRSSHIDKMDVVSILTLGDGNFTFSQSLQEALVKRSIHHHLVATSYDSHDDVILKYPDSPRILAQLTTRGACVRHDVNAIGSLDSIAPEHGFHYIIFNFPHLGIEDCKLHSYFLAHLFAK